MTRFFSKGLNGNSSAPLTSLNHTTLALLMVLFFLPSKTHAYNIPLNAGCTRFLHWAPNREIPYSINSKGCPGLSFEECETAVNAAFETVQNIDCANLSFKYLGSTDVNEYRHDQGEEPDNINLIVWYEEWPPNQNTSDKAVATIWRLTNGTPGELIEFGIALNGDIYNWATDSSSNAYDMQAVMTTQVLYALGLWHSESEQSILDGSYAYGSLEKRTPLEDDIAGICFLYPVDPSRDHWDTSCPADQHCEYSECVPGAPIDAGNQPHMLDSGNQKEDDSSIPAAMDSSKKEEKEEKEADSEMPTDALDRNGTAPFDKPDKNDINLDSGHSDSGRSAECLFNTDCDKPLVCTDGKCVKDVSNSDGCNCSTVGKGRKSSGVVSFLTLIFILMMIHSRIHLIETK